MNALARSLPTACGCGEKEKRKREAAEAHESHETPAASFRAAQAGGPQEMSKPEAKKQRENMIDLLVCLFVIERRRGTPERAGSSSSRLRRVELDATQSLI
jgi:hypothetical protein